MDLRYTPEKLGFRDGLRASFRDHLSDDSENGCVSAMRRPGTIPLDGSVFSTSAAGPFIAVQKNMADPTGRR